MKRKMRALANQLPCDRTSHDFYRPAHDFYRIAYDFYRIAYDFYRGHPQWPLASSVQDFVINPQLLSPQFLDTSSIFTYINKIIIVQRFHVQRSRLKKGLKPE
jgi:hypothetical protein